VPQSPASSRRKQLGVAAGMALGLAITVAALTWPHLPPGPVDPGSRAGAWLGCDLIAGFWLLFAVARLARHRFFSPDDIDGVLGPGSPRAKVLQSLIQNTLEQTVLAGIAYGAWLMIPSPELPTSTAWIAVGCFCLGRFLFFMGYERGAAARALGFALTFYPTVGLMVVRACLQLTNAPFTAL